MIICISGLSGSGKNSVGTMLAQQLGMRMIDPTFKTIAARQKIGLMDLHKKAERDHSIDRQFDEQLVSEAKKGNCVVTTWLGPWMIRDADMRVWLYAPRAARAARIARRDSMAPDEAERHVEDRDESNRLRYLEIYKINIYDHSGFDLIINTERFPPSHSAAIIAEAARQKIISKGMAGKKPSAKAKKQTKKKPSAKKRK